MIHTAESSNHDVWTIGEDRHARCRSSLAAAKVGWTPVLICHTSRQSRTVHTLVSFDLKVNMYLVAAASSSLLEPFFDTSLHAESIPPKQCALMAMLVVSYVDNLQSNRSMHFLHQPRGEALNAPGLISRPPVAECCSL